MGVSSCVVESQSIFIPCLIGLLGECGLDVISVASFVDLNALAELEPDVLFIDLDFVDDPPLECLSASRRILPRATIVAYVRARESGWFGRCCAAGASLVLDKSWPEAQIREQLRAALAMRSAGALLAELPTGGGMLAAE